MYISKLLLIKNSIVNSVSSSGRCWIGQKIIRSTLVLLNHVSMFLENSDKSCFLTIELFQEIKQADREEPKSTLK